MNQTHTWFAEVSRYAPDILDMAARGRDKSSYMAGFMLAVLCHNWPENDTARFLSRLTNDSHLTKYVLNMAGLSQKILRVPFLSLLDEAESPDDFSLMSEILTGDSHSDILKIYRERMSQPYVTGADILNLGATPGPLVGEILRHIYAMRLKGVPKDLQLIEAMKYIGGKNHD